MTFDLFPGDTRARPDPAAPLAERLRPRQLDDVAGQEHLTAPGKLLFRIAAGEVLPSLIFWGPPGSGKTTLARVVAGGIGARFVGLSAVTAGVKEIRETVALATRARSEGARTVLFLDEIHRFNKAQQDALLPHVERGTLVLFGATTENPSFEVNAALLSRCQVAVLHPLDAVGLSRILDRALCAPGNELGPRPVRLDQGGREALLRGADGDARRLLNALEIAVGIAAGTASGMADLVVTRSEVVDALQRPGLLYDQAGEEHYNQISALHKCVRASDPQGAVYWTARLLEAGEDPIYVARRLVRMAVEDVGLADPLALSQALAARDAVHFLGLPEGSAALVQAALYLALAPKSNRVYLAEQAAREAIARTGSLPVPERFRNAVTALHRDLGYGAGYRYDHDAPEAFTGQEGLPEPLAGTIFYEPSARGFEETLARRLRERKDAAKKPD